jgi:hypothetical protein
MGLMTAELGTVEQEPEKQQMGDEGYPDTFTAASTGALVFEPVNQV